MSDDVKNSVGNSMDEKVRVIQGRSPAYPYISLRRAVERADQIRDAGAYRAAMPPEVFYKIWGLGAKSSGARQTLAALNHFGLVDYVGRGNERKVELTELARQIVLDKQAESVDRKRAIRAAALKPPIHEDLWKQFQGGLLPDDVVIETFLVRDRSYNEQAAKSLIKEYRETLNYSSLNQPADSPSMDEATEDDESGEGAVDIGIHVGEFVNWESSGQIQWKAPRKVLEINEDDKGQPYLKVEGADKSVGWIPADQAIVQEEVVSGGGSKYFAAPPADRSENDLQEVDPINFSKEMNDLDEGRAVFIWPKDISPESVEDLEHWLEGIMRKARRRAGLPPKN